MADQDRIRGLFDALTPRERDKVLAVFAADLALGWRPSLADLEAVINEITDYRRPGHDSQHGASTPAPVDRWPGRGEAAAR